MLVVSSDNDIILITCLATVCNIFNVSYITNATFLITVIICGMFAKGMRFNSKMEEIISVLVFEIKDLLILDC